MGFGVYPKGKGAAESEGKTVEMLGAYRVKGLRGMSGQPVDSVVPLTRLRSPDSLMSLPAPGSAAPKDGQAGGLFRTSIGPTLYRRTECARRTESARLYER